MQIENNLFKSFINKVSIGGNIETIVLEFSKEGIKSKIRSVDNTILVNAILLKDKITKYKEQETIFIKSSSGLLDKLKLVDGIIRLEIIDNCLIICDTNGSSFVEKLSSAVVVDNVASEKLINNLSDKFDGGVILNKTVFEKIYKTIEIMKTEHTTFTVKNKKLSIINPNKIEENAIYEVNVDYKNCIVKLNSELLKKILKVFTNETINFSVMNNNCPIKFSETDEDMIVHTILAPIASEEQYEAEDVKK